MTFRGKATRTTKPAYRVTPGDVICIPGKGFRSVTETEFNLWDRSVVFTCGTEECIHEVGEMVEIAVYGTLPPSAPPMSLARSHNVNVAILALSLALIFCLLVASAVFNWSP